MDMIPELDLNLLGRTWNWRYDMETVFTWDKQTGKCFFLTPWGDFRSQDWATMAWAGIARQDPGLTFKEFVAKVSPVEIGPAIGLVMNAVILGSPKANAKDADEPDPTMASPTGTGRKPSRSRTRSSGSQTSGSGG
jgi:hypothetical protein